MQKLILRRVFLIEVVQGLLGVEEGVIGKQINGFRVIQLQLLLDDDDQLEHRKVLEDEDSMNRKGGTCCCRIISACSA